MKNPISTLALSGPMEDERRGLPELVPDDGVTRNACHAGREFSEGRYIMQGRTPREYGRQRLDRCCRQGPAGRQENA